jgi:hypothetical protein
VGVLEAGERLGGEIVVPARLDRPPSLAKAGEGKRMVAHGTNVVLSLPDTPPLDARACVERVDNAPTETIPRDR